MEIVAALCLGGAVTIAVIHLTPFAGALLVLAASVGGFAAGVAGLALLKSVDSFRLSMPSFDPVDFVAIEPEELLLDQPIEPEIAESRVVRLFAPEPGELVTRIDQYLDAGHGVSRRTAPDRPDASAALHEALAEIRRSLA